MRFHPDADLFDVLDQVITEPASRATSEKNLLAQILRANGVTSETRDVDPDKLYRELVFGRNDGGAKTIAQHFTVLAYPGERPQSPLQKSDVLLRVVLGHPGLGHVAVIADPTLWSDQELASAPFGAERQQPGLYAIVSEAGTYPHPPSQPFARRILDRLGQMLRGQLLLRPISYETQASSSDAERSGSITQDYSLKGIADGMYGNLPDDILMAILTTGENDDNNLTNRVFWDKYPRLSGKKLDSKDPKQQALREEWSRILHRRVRPVIWLRQIIIELDQHRGDIPRDFLLGWMAAESDGQVFALSSLGERGYFQIMWQGGEAKSQLGLTSSDFLRLSTDREFSIAKGVQLVQTYRQHFLQKYPIPEGSELLWRLTKGRHALPTALDRVLRDLMRAGTTITWQEVSQRLPKMASIVDLTFDYSGKLKALADRVPAGTAVTEFYSEAAPWFSEQELHSFEPRMFEEQPGKAPQCGFHGPNGVFVTEAVLRSAVADAALNERKVWWVGPGNTAQVLVGRKVHQKPLGLPEAFEKHEMNPALDWHS